MRMRLTGLGTEHEEGQGRLLRSDVFAAQGSCTPNGVIDDGTRHLLGA